MDVAVKDDVAALVVKAAELWRANDDDAIVTLRRYWEVGGILLLIKSKTEMSARWTEWLDEHEEELGFSKKKGLRCLQLRRENQTLTSKISAEAAQAMLCKFWGNAVRGTAGTGDNEWFTPEEYVEAARIVMGGIDLDPATHRAAQKVVRAKKFFTKEDDGLKQEWHGRVWLNPPYAQPLISEFVDKMIAERSSRRVTSGIMLTHNYTDTEWFQALTACADAICFTKGRIRFVSPEGELAAPTQGQAFSYFGSERGKFLKEFKSIGSILVRA